MLLRTKLVSELADQSLDRRRLAEMADLIPFRDEINALEEARWRLEPFDPEAVASRLSRLPDQVKQLRERIEKGKKAAATDKKETHEKPATKEGAAARKDDPAPLEVAAPLALARPRRCNHSAAP